MRISLLEQREPFGKIFEETMNRFWSYKLGEEVVTQYLDIKDKSSIQNDSSIFYGNVYLNNFSKKNTSPVIFEVIRKEYSRSNRKILRLVQWLYVKLATTKFILKLFAQRKLVINTNIQENDFLILGGNNRLRILKPLEKKSVIILKSGFSKEFILKEIELRRQYNIDFAPQLIDFSVEEEWIEEGYAPGTPINRLENDLQLKYEKEALSLVTKTIIEPSLKKIKAKPHLKSLCDNLTQYLNEHFTDNSFAPFVELLAEIERLVNEVSENEETMVSWSHGDFQMANILLQESNEIVVIDWETSNHRCAFYDFITLKYNIRYSNELSSWINQVLSTDNQLTSYIRALEPNMLINKKTIILHFLLDEVTYQIRNNCQKIFYNPYQGIAHKIEHYQDVLNLLKKN